MAATELRNLCEYFCVKRLKVYIIRMVESLGKHNPTSFPLCFLCAPVQRWMHRKMIKSVGAPWINLWGHQSLNANYAFQFNYTLLVTCLWGGFLIMAIATCESWFVAQRPGSLKKRACQGFCLCFDPVTSTIATANQEKEKV